MSAPGGAAPLMSASFKPYNRKYHKARDLCAARVAPKLMLGELI